MTGKVRRANLLSAKRGRRPKGRLNEPNSIGHFNKKNDSNLRK